MSDSVNHHRTFEVLTAEPVRSRRKPRLRSDEDKARLVAGAFSPGGNVSATARSEGLDPSQLYAWRRKALKEQSFCWPGISAARMRLDQSQLMALLAGMDWKKIRPTKVRRPLLTG
jgi:transposase